MTLDSCYTGKLEEPLDKSSTCVDGKGVAESISVYQVIIQGMVHNFHFKGIRGQSKFETYFSKWYL